MALQEVPDAMSASSAAQRQNLNQINICPMCGEAGATQLAQRTSHGKKFDLCKCQQCTQHFCSPKPTAEEIVGFYQGDHHSDLRAPGASERLFGRKFRRYRDWILHFNISGRSLDIGTATGLFPFLLKQAGFDAEGVEFNEASARWGEAHYQVKIDSNSLTESVASKGTFDLISMTDVLEHTENPLSYLQSVRQYLKPRGFMLITFPNIDSIESRLLGFLARVLRRDWIWSCCHIPLHVWEFTPATAKAMFVKSGFEVVGFRRSQDEVEALRGKLALLTWPLCILTVPAVGRWAGTQMEFIVRRVD
jgi:SAM-dependent methyltransferase